MSLIIFDTETGGLLPHHPTIQIAGIAVDADWREVDAFERKIAFTTTDADPEALELNYFDPEVWRRESVTLRGAIDDFGSFLRNHADCQKISRAGKPYTVARLCGHNAATFDMPRVESHFKGHGAFFPADYRVLDTLQIFRWLRFVRPDVPESGKLTDIAAFYGVKVDGAHDALFDCRLTAAIAPRILADIRGGAC